MSDTPRIPISVAERIGKKYEKQQVIVIALDRERDQTSLTTWGKDRAHCREIAETGEYLMACFDDMWRGKGKPMKRTEVQRLQEGLEDALSRLRRCIIHGGTDEEYAEICVAGIREKAGLTA